MRLLAVFLVFGLAAPILASVDESLVYKCCVEKRWGDNAPCSSICQEKASEVTEIRKAIDIPFDFASFAKAHRFEGHLQDSDGDGLKDFLEKKQPDVLVANAKGKHGKTASTFLEVSAAARNPYVRDLLWPKAVIPYKWHSSVATTVTSGDGKTARENFLAAMADWEKGTCLQFVLDASSSDAVIMKGTSSACGARIGTSAKGHNCDVKMTSAKSSFLHELGHVIGFEHTNTRSDASPAHITFKLDHCASDLLTNEAYDGCWLNSDGVVMDRFQSWVDARTQVCVTDGDETTVVDNYLKGKYGVPGTTYDKSVPADVLKCRQAVCVKQWLGQYDYPPQSPASPIAGDYDCSDVMHYPRPNDCFEEGDCDGKPSPGANGLTANNANAVNQIYGCSCHKVKLPFESAASEQTLCHHGEWTVDDFKLYAADQGGSLTADPFNGASYEVHVGGVKKTGKVSEWGLSDTSEIEIKKV